MTFNLEPLAVGPGLTLPGVTGPLTLAGRGGPMTVTVAQVLDAVRRLASRTDFGSCWETTGGTRNGYPLVSMKNYPVYGHRLSHLAFNGPLAQGHEVCHTCDNPPCWRPSHLFGGTRQDNVHDAMAKSRASMPPPPRTGAAHQLATLTDEDVARLRSIAGEHSQRELATMFDVSQSTIWRLLHGKVRT